MLNVKDAKGFNYQPSYAHNGSEIWLRFDPDVFRGIPWLAYLLHHSLVSDAHRPEFGPVGSPGYMAFIEADGSLRHGHDIINRFF